jgi:hypothetical protein
LDRQYGQVQEWAVKAAIGGFTLLLLRVSPGFYV